MGSSMGSSMAGSSVARSSAVSSGAASSGVADGCITAVTRPDSNMVSSSVAQQSRSRL